MASDRTVAGQRSTLRRRCCFFGRGKYPRAPGYSRHLLLVVGKKLLGDGLLEPRIAFKKAYLNCQLVVQSSDGWEFRESYRRPWVREFLRKTLFGSSIDYGPVDIVEQLIEVVRFNRRHWLVEGQGGE